MNYEDLLALVQSRHLTIFGTTSKKSETIVLLGPYEPSYWPAICSSPEWNDEKPDPIDNNYKNKISSNSGTYLAANFYISKGDAYKARKILEKNTNNPKLLQLKFFSNLVS